MLYKCPRCSYLTEYISHMDRHMEKKHNIVKDHTNVNDNKTVAVPAPPAPPASSKNEVIKEPVEPATEPTVTESNKVQCNPLECTMCHKVFANEINRQRHEKDKCPKRPKNAIMNHMNTAAGVNAGAIASGSGGASGSNTKTIVHTTTNNMKQITTTNENKPNVTTKTNTYIYVNGANEVVSNAIDLIIENTNKKRGPDDPSITEQELEAIFKNATVQDVKDIISFCGFLAKYFEKYPD